MIKTRFQLRQSAFAGALAFLLGAASSALAQSGPAHVFPMNTGQSAAQAAAVAAGVPLTDHGGPVLQTASTYAIYWGKQTAFPTDLKAAMPLFLEGFGGSVYSYILDQYLPAVFTSSFDTTTVSDSTSPPSASPSTTKIVNEACKYIKQGVLPLNPISGGNSSGGLYFVFTSNFPAGINFCGWHSYGTCNAQTIAVSYVPNLKNQSGCNPGNLYNANTYSEGTRADVNVVAHEYSEAATDPELNAWYDSSGYEIGDKCAWIFSAPVTIANGTTWQLQQEWSNAIGGCAQSQATP